MSKRAKQRNNMILLYAGLAIIIFLLVFPLVYAVGGSFKSTEEFLLGGMKIFPDVWHPENYMKAWKQANFARYTFNSVFCSNICIGGYCDYFYDRLYHVTQ